MKNTITLASFMYPLVTVLEVPFIPAMTMMLPVIIIAAIAGGYIGYKIYRRVDNITQSLFLRAEFYARKKMYRKKGDFVEECVMSPEFEKILIIYEPPLDR